MIVRLASEHLRAIFVSGLGRDAVAFKPFDLTGKVALVDDAMEALKSGGFQAKVLPRMPVRRWGTPEDFAAIAIYLASDTSKFHTRQELIIEGGYMMF